MFPWSFRIKNRLECRRTLLLSSMIWDLPVAKGCGQTPRHNMCVHASQILTNAQNHNSILWILDACSVLLSRFWTIVVSEHPISVLEYDTCVCPYKSQLIVSRFWTIVVSHTPYLCQSTTIVFVSMNHSLLFFLNFHYIVNLSV